MQPTNTYVQSFTKYNQKSFAWEINDQYEMKRKIFLLEQKNLEKSTFDSESVSMTYKKLNLLQKC